MSLSPPPPDNEVATSRTLDLSSSDHNAPPTSCSGPQEPGQSDGHGEGTFAASGSMALEALYATEVVREAFMCLFNCDESGLIPLDSELTRNTPTHPQTPADYSQHYSEASISLITLQHTLPACLSFCLDSFSRRHPYMSPSTTSLSLDYLLNHSQCQVSEHSRAGDTNHLDTWSFSPSYIWLHVNQYRDACLNALYVGVNGLNKYWVLRDYCTSKLVCPFYVMHCMLVTGSKTVCTRFCCLRQASESHTSILKCSGAHSGLSTMSEQGRPMSS